MKVIARIGILLVAAAVVVGVALLLDGSGPISSSGPGGAPDGVRSDSRARPGFAPGGQESLSPTESGGVLQRSGRGGMLAGDGGPPLGGEHGGGAFAAGSLLIGLLRNIGIVAMIALVVAGIRWLISTIGRSKRVAASPGV